MAISAFEENFIGIILNIFHNGYRYESPDGTVMKRMQNQILSVDLEKEFPILKARKVSWGNAVTKVISIIKPQQPRTGDTHTVGDNSGPLETIIASLAQSPMGVSANVKWSGSKGYSTCNHMWNIIDGKLNGCVSQTTCDICADADTVVMTFSILNHMISRHLGVTPGTMIFVWNDCYVSEECVYNLSSLVEQYRKLLLAGMIDSNGGKENLQTMLEKDSSMTDIAKKANDEARDISDDDIDVFTSNPSLYYDSNVKSIWDATENHLRVTGYKSLAAIEF